jgi:hypothetical protein
MHNEIMELVGRMEKLGVSSINVKCVDDKPFISIDPMPLLDMFGNDVKVSQSKECDGILAMEYKTAEYTYISAIIDYEYDKWQKEQAAKESVA